MTAEITITIITVFFKITLTVLDVFISESQRNCILLCNIMGDVYVSSITGLVWIISLCVSMVVSYVCIAISVIKLINHMETMTKGVEDFISRQNASSHKRSGVCNVLILFLITKTLTYLPYPVFLLWCSLSGTAPGDALLYIMQEIHYPRVHFKSKHCLRLDHFGSNGDENARLLGNKHLLLKSLSPWK